MNYLLYISVFVGFFFASAQQNIDSINLLSVEYKFYRNLKDNKYNLPYHDTHSLVNYNALFSTYKKKEAESESLKRDGNQFILKLGSEEKMITFKDFKNDTLMAVYPVLTKHIKVGEKIPKMTWKLENKTKKILGYNCQKATTTYRGRNYIAYYAPDIPIFDGPFKFSGLPGLILSVNEENNKITFEAVYLERKTTTTMIESPIAKEKLLSWQEYTERYKKAYDRFRKAFKSRAAQVNSDGSGVFLTPLIDGYPKTIEVLEFND